MRTRNWLIFTLTVAVLASLGTYFVTRTTTSTTTSTSTSTSTTLPASWTAVWPTSASGVRYLTPKAAAQGFATDFLSMSSPIVGAFQAGDTRSGEVPVSASVGGATTTVLVRQLSADNTWWVLGSSTPDINITSPSALSTISSPLDLRGTGTAFEGLINVTLRDDSSATPLLITTVMGGGNGVMAPFQKSAAFVHPNSTFGALVLYQRSAKDGSVVAASCLRVRFG